jgi:hypothetical protein
MNLRYLLSTILVFLTLGAQAATYTVGRSCTEETVKLAKDIFKYDAITKTQGDVSRTDNIEGKKLSRMVPSIKIEKNDSVWELIVLGVDGYGLFWSKNCTVSGLLMVQKDLNGNLLKIAPLEL